MLSEGDPPGEDEEIHFAGDEEWADGAFGDEEWADGAFGDEEWAGAPAGGAVVRAGAAAASSKFNPRPISQIEIEDILGDSDDDG